MKVKTKYSLRDFVWFIHQNEVCKGLIWNIHFEMNFLNQKTIIYKVHFYKGGECDTTFTEDQLFETKKELLDTL